MELTYKEKKVLELPNEMLPLDRAMIVFGEEGVSSGAGFQVPVTICLLTQSSISEIHLVVCMWGVLRLYKGESLGEKVVVEMIR